MLPLLSEYEWDGIGKSAVHKALTTYFRESGRRNPTTRSAPCAFLSAYLAVSHLSSPFPIAIPKSQILSPKSRVIPRVQSQAFKTKERPE